MGVSLNLIAAADEVGNSPGNVIIIRSCQRDGLNNHAVLNYVNSDWPVIESLCMRQNPVGTERGIEDGGLVKLAGE